MGLKEMYARKILRLLYNRKPGATICPSEVLPVDQKKMKEKMESVREAARSLVQQNKIEITQKGKVVEGPHIKGPIRLRLKEEQLVYRSQFFDYTLDYKKLNLRDRPELYKVGKKEQGVLLVEPYKSELLPVWRFKTASMAKISAETIFSMFLTYKKNEDFVGMDMARKFLEMGYTRSRRYANHAGGKKYAGVVPLTRKGLSGSHGREILPLDLDEEKSKAALIFKKFHALVEEDELYSFLKIGWRKLFG